MTLKLSWSDMGAVFNNKQLEYVAELAQWNQHAIKWEIKPILQWRTILCPNSTLHCSFTNLQPSTLYFYRVGVIAKSGHRSVIDDITPIATKPPE